MKKTFFYLLAVLTLTAGAYDNAGQAMKAGHTFRGQKKITEAAAAYDKAFKLAKNDYERYNAMFYKAITSQDVDTTVKILREAMKYAKNGHHISSGLYHIAHYLVRQKKYDQANEELLKIKTLVKGTSNFYTESVPVAIGRNFYVLKKYDEALKYAREAVASKRKDVSTSAWALVYDASIARKDMKEAENAVNALLAKKELTGMEFFTSRRLAVDFFCRQKKYDEALKYAQEIENEKTCNAFARAVGLYHIASIYQRTGKKDLAVAAWQKLEKCSVPYFRNIAKRNLAALNKKK